MRLVAALTFGLVVMMVVWALLRNGFDATLLFLAIFTLAAVVEILLASSRRRG
jgi:type IV secretory pathway TrbL component